MIANIAGFGSSFPPALDQQQAWDGFFSSHFTKTRIASRVWRSAGVDRRHCAVDPRLEDLSLATTAERMQRFLELAVPLTCEAVTRALDSAGLVPTDVDQFTVVSCTGYSTPGIDILVARELGMKPDVERLNVGHMGCYAALPALASVTNAAIARGQIGMLACVELTSLHVQPATDDVEQIVAHALFSDAAAAVAIVPGGGGIEVVDLIARTDSDTADLMTWQITDQGFRMRLSSKVPGVLDRHVLSLTQELLGRHGLTTDDIAHWAIHPGGPRIIDTVARRLGLDDDAVADSRETLRTHGNCSSATTLLVLERMSASGRLQADDHIVAMAFGPGLTLYAALLRVRPTTTP